MPSLEAADLGFRFWDREGSGPIWKQSAGKGARMAGVGRGRGTWDLRPVFFVGIVLVCWWPE